MEIQCGSFGTSSPAPHRAHPDVYSRLVIIIIGARLGLEPWLERRNRDGKVAGSSPGRRDGRIFISKVIFLCWLLFRYPFHPRVTCQSKRFRSFCQSAGGRLQLNTHAPYVYGFAWSDVAWCMVVWCTQNWRRDSTAAVSRGTSHITTQLRCKYTTSVHIQNALSRWFRIACDKSAVSSLDSDHHSIIQLLLLLSVLRLPCTVDRALTCSCCCCCCCSPYSSNSCCFSVHSPILSSSHTASL